MKVNANFRLVFFMYNDASRERYGYFDVRRLGRYLDKFHVYLKMDFVSTVKKTATFFILLYITENSVSELNSTKHTLIYAKS